MYPFLWILAEHLAQTDVDDNRLWSLSPYCMLSLSEALCRVALNTAGDRHVPVPLPLFSSPQARSGVSWAVEPGCADEDGLLRRTWWQNGKMRLGVSQQSLQEPWHLGGLHILAKVSCPRSPLVSSSSGVHKHSGICDCVSSALHALHISVASMGLAQVYILRS